MQWSVRVKLGLCTLRSQINVPGRLFFSAAKSTRYVLILDGTFIIFLKIGPETPEIIKILVFLTIFCGIFAQNSQMFGRLAARIYSFPHRYAHLRGL